MITPLPIVRHTRGTTFTRIGLHTLPTGNFTPESSLRSYDGTLIEEFSCSLVALDAPDSDGYTHTLRVLANASGTEDWPLGLAIWVTQFVDDSATPVVIAAVSRVVEVGLFNLGVDSDDPLAVLSNSAVSVLRGEEGPAGADGRTVLNGEGAPSSGIGENGDFYLDSQAVALYGPKTSGAWGSGTSLIGPTGATGATGSAGATGATGAAGAAGQGVPVGGTTGQVLAKASGADYATEWVAPSGGTIDATPTDGSSNSVSSNGTFDALAGKSDTSHNHTGIYDPAGTAASAVSAHEGAADPHPGYALESALGSAAAASTTDFAPAAHVGAGGSAHANAIAAGAAGFMSGTDKSKLDGIASGAQVNPTDTDGLSEGSTNLYHTAARVLGQVLTGLSTAAGTVVTSAHTVLQAIGFLQKQVSDNATAITGKQATLVSGTNIKTINSTSLLGSGDITVGASIAPLVVEDANTIAQRNGVTAQNSYVYNTISGANYERLRIGWASNRVELRTESGGTGSLRAMNLPGEIRLMPQSGNLGEYVSFSTSYRQLIIGADSGAGVVISGSHSKVMGTTTALTLSTAQNYGASSTITIQAADPSNNNLNGGAVLIAGQNGGNIAGNNNSGGPVNIVGGTAAGSGSIGAVNLAYTGSAARGAVKCWGPLTLASGLSTAIAAKTANYTATADDGSIEVDATSGAVTITLPAASGAAGRIYTIKKADASGNAVTVDPNASETIDGATTVSLASQYSTITIQANAAGTAWHKVSGV